MIKIVSKEIPHAYRNKYLRASGNTVVISGGATTGGNASGGSGRGDLDTSIFAQRDEANTFTKDNIFKGGITIDNPAPSLIIKRNTVQVATLGYDASKLCVSLSSTEANKGLNLFDDGRFEFAEHAVYHAGNSNLNTVDWAAKTLFSNVLKAANQAELVKYDGTNTVLGALTGITTIQSKASDLLHSKGGANHIIWDASNSNLNSVDWKAKNIFAKDHVQNDNFISGYTGTGCRISADGKAECTDLWVRGTMNVYELIVNKINATNGALAVSDTGKVATVSGSTLTLTGDNDNMNTFRVGDVLKCQRFTGKNVKLYFLTVTAITGLNVTFTYRSGGSGANTVAAGDVLVRWNSSDVNRKGLLYLTASDSQAPYMDVLYNEQARLRLGRLDGIVDSAFPTGTQPSGFGLYAQNAFLKGVFVLTSGKTVDGEITVASNKANAAQSTANNAQSTANGAKSAADAAQSTANSAQTAANNAKSAADTAQSTANAAKTNAQTANNLLTDIANDNKLTAQEKQQTKKEWDVIVSEKPKNDASADKYSISKTAYTTAYNTLNNYLTPLLASLNTTSNITGSDFRAKFKAYYDARTDLLNAISAKAKTLADAAQTTANNAQAAANNANNAITTIRTELSAVDGKITLAVNESKTYTNNSINNLQIGNRNFARNTANLKTYTLSTGAGSLGYPTKGFKKGDVITVSFEIDMNIPSWTSGMKMLQFDQYYNYMSFYYFQQSDNKKGWLKRTAQLTIGNVWNTTNPATEVMTSNPYMRMDNISTELANGGYVKVRNFKVEKGNKATDWTPAPEDMAQDAQDKANAALNAAKTYTNSEISVVNGKINLKVDSSTFNALGNRVSSYESRITQTENSIKLKADQTTVNGINTRLQSAEAKITPDAIKLTVKEQTTQLANAAVNGLQIGGTNLLTNTALLININGWGATRDTGKVLEGRYSLKQVSTGRTSNTWSGAEQTNSTYLIANAGEVFTASIYSLTDNRSGIDIGCAMEIRYYNSSGARITQSGVNIVPSANNVWQRFTLTGTCPGGTVRVGFVWYVTRNGTLWVNGMKLEKGNKATDWTASPYDGPTVEQIKSQFTMDASGISMLGKKIAFTGVITFNSLASDAQNKINAAQTTANTARTEKIEMARLGTTVVSGGYIKTNLINTDELVAKKVSAATGSLEKVEIKQSTLNGNEVGIFYGPASNTTLRIMPLWIGSAPNNAFSIEKSGTSQFNIVQYIGRRRGNSLDRCLYIDGIAEVYGRLGIAKATNTGFNSSFPALVTEGIANYGQYCFASMRRITAGGTYYLNDTDSYVFTNAGADVNVYLPTTNLNKGQMIWFSNRNSKGNLIIRGSLWGGGAWNISPAHHGVCIYIEENKAWDTLGLD